MAIMCKIFLGVKEPDKKLFDYNLLLKPRLADAMSGQIRGKILTRKIPAIDFTTIPINIKPILVGDITQNDHIYAK
jgi:hypothetical protein